MRKIHKFKNSAPNSVHLLFKICQVYVNVTSINNVQQKGWVCGPIKTDDDNDNS